MRVLGLLVAAICMLWPTSTGAQADRIPRCKVQLIAKGKFGTFITIGACKNALRRSVTVPYHRNMSWYHPSWGSAQRGDDVVCDALSFDLALAYRLSAEEEIALYTGCRPAASTQAQRPQDK